MLLLTGAAITGTRRKVKVEKIPVLSTASAAESCSQVKPIKENHRPSTKTSDTAINSGDAGHTVSEIIPPGLSSESSLPTMHSKQLSQTENTLHLTTQVQDTVQSGIAEAQNECQLSFVGKREALEYTEQPARTEEKSLRVSSALNCEVADSPREVITNIGSQPDETLVHSAPTTKAVNRVEQIECKSCNGVQSTAASGSLDGRGKVKPKLISVRCATDAPDQNCKTQ